MLAGQQSLFFTNVFELVDFSKDINELIDSISMLLNDVDELEARVDSLYRLNILKTQCKRKTHSFKV
jgi:hypothetical protein